MFNMRLKKGFLRIAIVLPIIGVIIFFSRFFAELTSSFCPLSVCPLLPFILTFIIFWIIFKLARYIIKGFGA